MPLLEIDFEWPVDDGGYRYVERSKDEPRSTLLHAASPGDQIIRNGGALRPARPLDHNRTLFRQFANLDGSPKSCVQFAEAFGLLGFGASMPAADPSRVGLVDEPLYFWTDAIATMRTLIEHWEQLPKELFLARYGEPTSIANLRARLAPGDVAGTARLLLQPASLFHAMLLQFAQFVVSGKDLKQCEWCSNWFDTGAGAKRTVARFCSDRCRMSFHNHRRAQGDER